MSSIVTEANFWSTWSPRARGMLRIISGLVYIQEGTAKIFHWPHVAKFDSVQILSLLGFAGVLDVVGGMLLIIGLFTRWTAFILSGEMAFAYFMVFQPRGLFPVQNGGNDTILLCFILLYLFLAGGGAFALDNFLGNTRRDPRH
ncbi:DoxX family membrane protein [Paraburkholderia sp. CNPSo 3157]|uniref:DoxX family membrane protein n=1 Tax=Paraburkholderia franconis TaxID=2654983 RepID=A0A7X1TLV5_9BURK|nr:DoxX family protein [Paraburkholderia franconis]MPW24030.1 DoxX family membrane protein [Paraburkholderia franconis]